MLPMKPFFSTPSTAALVLLSLASLMAIVFIVVYTNDFRFQSLLSGSCVNQPSRSADFVEHSTTKPDIRLLIGIHTLPDLYERRTIVRHAYALQSKPSNAHIDVRFVFCNLTTEEQRVLVAMEIMLYDDIIILNCSENLDKGKTYDYFSSLPTMFDGTPGDGNRPYDYVMKTDDDTYIRLHNLAETLTAMPRNDLYFGFVTPCHKPQAPFRFMSGIGYILSWDIVEWIATSEIPRKYAKGVEDVMTGVWMKEGDRGKNRFDMNPKMYDYMEHFETCFRHPFVPDTIGIHRLKNNMKWARTLSYFNVTEGLKPSKLYHLH